MKTLLTFIALTALFGIALVQAETMSVPSAEKAAFTFDVPTNWHPKLDAEDESVEATAPDKHVYVCAWVAKGSDQKAFTEDLGATLKDSMKSVDPDPKQEQYEMNGIKYTVIKGSGIDKREGGKVRFQVALFDAGPDKVGVVYADYDANAPADTMDVMQGIMKSIKLKS